MKYVTSSISALDSKCVHAKNTSLGNVLFQISMVYGICNKIGPSVAPVYPYVKQFCDKLKQRYGYDHSHTIYRNVLTGTDISFHCGVSESNNKSFDQNIINVVQNSNSNIIVTGYVESHLYFHHCRDDILKLFSIDDNSLHIIKSKYPELFENNNTVAIHFRSSEWGNIDHDYEYYNNAIKYVSGYVKNPLFLVFSDDFNSIKFTKLSQLTSYKQITGNPDYIDLWAMSLCKHNIIIGSTFGWWGGYLNSNPDKIVTYPKKYNWEANSIFIGL